MIAPRIAILVLGYNSSQTIKSCLDALSNQTYIHKLYYVDNNSSDESVSLVKLYSPDAVIIRNKINYGYARGNNIGLRRIFSKQFDACLVLNPDVILAPDALNQLARSYVRLSKLDNKIGLIQPVLLLAQNNTKLNTAGNSIHFLGYGYCSQYLKAYRPFRKEREIVSASGSALYITRKYYETVGDFDESFFMYNEDQQLSWRGLMRGYRHFVSAKAKAYHAYVFDKGKSKMYHTEKNRLQMIMTNYQKKTLLLLMPLLVMNEIIIAGYYLINGWIMQKISSYIYVMSRLDIILDKRKNLQTTRTVSDAILTKRFDSELKFAGINNGIMTHIISPFYSWYLNIFKNQI